MQPPAPSAPDDRAKAGATDAASNVQAAPWRPLETLRSATPANRLARRRDGRPGGFSLSEVLVVVGLIGIIVLFSTPALLDFFRSMKVRTAAERVVSNMRLARQVAVSRRNHVTFKIEASETQPTYSAWEDTELDNTRDADGNDNVAGNDDDEPYVVEPDTQLATNQVKLVDVYNDTTPNNHDDVFSASDSVLDGNDEVTLRFFPNGQVQRIGTDGNPVATDTLLRVRMDGDVGPDRLDRWYASINRPGKVQKDFIRDPSW